MAEAESLKGKIVGGIREVGNSEDYCKHRWHSILYEGHWLYG